MNILSFFYILFILVTILWIIYTHKGRTGLPTNWPILGMIPGILVNAHRLTDYATEILIQSRGTFVCKGPWLGNMDLILTTDPLDIHHILSKNFSNYPKGEKVYQILEILGNGILNSDGRIWEMSRGIIFSILMHTKFQSATETVVWDIVENRLLPILESVSETGTVIDFERIFGRFSFDIVSKLFLDNDPETLSLDFPDNKCLTAFTDAEEAIFLRNITPLWLWKLKRFLRVGIEKKLSDAKIVLDELIYKCLAQNQKGYINMNHDVDGEEFVFFEAITRELKYHIGTFENPTSFLRDNLISLMAAGKDTTSSSLSWFFYLLARNPTVQDKILEEIHTHLEVNPRKRWDKKELDKMVYLNGAVCETLRLYPPIPFNNKSALQPETLPSGHKVDKNTTIILCYYPMGRIKSIWGEDCMDFKPERWISSSGGIKQPSYKFPIFNAGPRTCLGKSMALSVLKIVATTIIYHYQTQLVEGHHVVPANSMVLQMKHGLKVRLNKRSELN